MALSGLALGSAVLTRPHIAVIALCIGAWVAIQRRSWSWRPLVGVGAGSLLGLTVLLQFNHLIWGELTISGGYSSAFAERLTESSFEWFIGNIAGSLVDPQRGLLVWAPFIVVLACGAIAVRKTATDWSVAAAVILYLLVQLRANRYPGGEGHFAYRYPLEALTAAAPHLYLGFLRWVRPRPLATAALAITFTWAITAQAVHQF